MYRTPEGAIAEIVRQCGLARENVWKYEDADGNPVLYIVRLGGEKVAKTFRPVCRHGKEWIRRDPPRNRPLYSLPRLLGAGPDEVVYVVEGEKAADAGAACGLLATTSSFGAKSASMTDWSPLRGRDVVILPDRDPAGEQYAEAVGSLATAAGASTVRIIRLSDAWAELPEGGDIADALLLAGGDGEAVCAALAALMSKTDPESFPPVDVEDEGDARDARDVSDVSTEGDTDWLRRCEVAYLHRLSTFRGNPQHRRRSALWAAVREMVKRLGGTDRAADQIVALAKHLDERFPGDWDGGKEAVELELMSALERFNADLCGTDVRSAAAEAIGLDARSRPACLADIGQETARLVFLTGMLMARQRSEDEFWASEAMLADAVGKSQEMVNKSIRLILRPRGLLERIKEPNYAKGEATTYRLFASPEAIMAGATPGDTDRPPAAASQEQAQQEEPALAAAGADDGSGVPL